MMTRRVALCGLATVSSAAALVGAAHAALPVAAESVGERCVRLAEQLSHALAEFDDAAWAIEVRPAFQDRTMTSLKPVDIAQQNPKTTNEVAMEQLRSMAKDRSKRVLIRQIQDHADAIGQAMSSLHGEHFKVRVDHERAFVLIIPAR